MSIITTDSSMRRAFRVLLELYDNLTTNSDAGRPDERLDQSLVPRRLPGKWLAYVARQLRRLSEGRADG